MTENEMQRYSSEDYGKFNQKKGVFNETMEWLESIVISVFLVVLVFSFVFRLTVVEGSSMFPTLENGQRLVVSHLMYTPEQGDIIVANSRGLNKTIVKRVIATEGQKVMIDFDSHTVTVDGVTLDEPYINEATARNDGGFEYPVEVPQGCIFVMGDNRNHSTDSRSPMVGFINTSDVLGKVVFRIYPFNVFGKI